MERSPITCHVLDASLGKPAKDVSIILQELETTDNEAEVFRLLAKGITDSNGRCSNLLPFRNSETAKKEKTNPVAGKTYRIIFRTKEYFDRTNRKTFYPSVEISFTVEDAEEHYHIPLLISPYSYTTYRGS